MQNKAMENWIPLTEEQTIAALLEESAHKPVVVFKHSVRCPISANAKHELAQHWKVPTDQAAFYYLDLIQYRNISNAIAQRLEIPHESPQVMVIRNEKVVYEASHWAINTAEILQYLD